MDNSGFLKTVSFGGFDKKDVLAYVDDLNTKIYNLETELEEAKARMGQDGESAGLVGDKEYEELLAKERAKVNELMANNDTLKLSVQSYEDMIREKDAEIERLKDKVSDLEANANTTDTKPDVENIGDYFVQAKMLADKMVAEAGVSAKKINEDAKELAEQVVDEANEKASGIVSAANDKAGRIVSDAEQEAASIREAANEVKAAVQTEMNSFSENITKLNDIIAAFSVESTEKLEKAQGVIFEVEDALQKGKPITHTYHTASAVEEPVFVTEPKEETVEEIVEEAVHNAVDDDFLNQFAIDPNSQEENADDQKNVMDMAAMEQFVSSMSTEDQAEEANSTEEDNSTSDFGPIQLEDMM